MRGGLDRRILQRDELRHPFLQEQIGRLDAGIGVEPLLHRQAVQGVVEREQAHALMVRHPRPQHHAAFVMLGQTLGSVVDGFVITEASAHARARQALEVVQHRLRSDRRRQK